MFLVRKFLIYLSVLPVSLLFGCSSMPGPLSSAVDIISVAGKAFVTMVTGKDNPAYFDLRPLDQARLLQDSFILNDRLDLGYKMPPWQSFEIPGIHLIAEYRGLTGEARIFIVRAYTDSGRQTGEILIATNILKISPAIKKELVSNFLKKTTTDSRTPIQATTKSEVHSIDGGSAQQVSKFGTYRTAILKIEPKSTKSSTDSTYTPLIVDAHPPKIASRGVMLIPTVNRSGIIKSPPPSDGIIKTNLVDNKGVRPVNGSTSTVIKDNKRKSKDTKVKKKDTLKEKEKTKKPPRPSKTWPTKIAKST